MKTLSFPVENESDGQEIAVESSINYLKMIVDKKENNFLPNQTGNEELTLDLDSKETLGTTSIGGRV